MGLSNEIPEISAGAAALEARVSIESQTNGFLSSETVEPNAPPVTNSIEGINFDENATNGGFYNIPPDPIGAAGPNHVVSVVNTSIEWHLKDGTQQHSQSLANFFSSLSPANGTFDPKVIYDQASNRFVVVTLEVVGRSTGNAADDASRILLAVSDDSNPNGTWHFQAINSLTSISGVNYWADYPGFATDGQAIYVTNNLFQFEGAGSFGGSRLWIIGKGEGSGGLYDGGASSVTIHNPYAGGGIATTTQPAQIFGAAPGSTGTFLVSYSGLSDGTNEFFQVVRVDNPLTSPTFSQQFVSAGNIDNTAAATPDAPQLGTATLIDTGDRRAINAVWRNNSLYLATAVIPTSGADAGQQTAHWARMNTTTLASITVAEQGNIGGEDIATGTYTYYPSIAVNSMGDVAVGFAASSPTIYAGAYYTMRNVGDPAGTMQASEVAAAGLAPYVRTFGGARNRWGDYSGTVVDPANDSFWIFNEYALTQGTILLGEDGRWGTRWANFAVPVPVVTATSVNGGVANRSGIRELTLTFDQAVTLGSPMALNLFNHTTGMPVDLTNAVLMG
ncbi:MAG: hypothetical protein KDA86_21875, partial [Planctomycetaceae bacterium]|nr:hypothetical protein [Planctomycetaceae bacterium]